MINIFSLPLASNEKYVQRLINDEGSVYIDLNNNGDIAFIGVDKTGNPQVYVYSKGNTIQKTETLQNSYSYYSLIMNEKGDLVWVSGEKQSDNNYKYFIKGIINDKFLIIYEFPYFNLNAIPGLDINNNGDVTWCYSEAYGEKPNIFLYQNGSVTNITNNQNGKNGARINDAYLVWYSDNRISNDWYNYIFMCNISTKALSTISSRGSSCPIIDKNNDVVYLNNDGKVNNLKMYQNGNTIHIGDSVYSGSGNDYDINNNQVVWVNYSSRITLWSNGVSSYISPAGQKCYSPKVNSKGAIAWLDDKKSAWIMSNGTLYNASEKYGDCPYHIQLNEDGIAAWRGYDWDYYGAPIYASYFQNVGQLHGKIVESVKLMMWDEIDSLKGLSDVLVTDGINSTLTDNTGNFTLSDIEFGQTKIQFIKDSYVFTPSEINININEDEINLENDIVAKLSTGVEIEFYKPEFIISPNPASDYIYINVGNWLACSLQEDLKIYNTLGECVINYELRNTNYGTERIDISALSPGVYFVHSAGKISSFIKN
jgi:hypothetical protein